MSNLKLSVTEYTELRVLSQSGTTDSALALRFGISEATVQRYKHDSARKLTHRYKNYIREKTCYKCGALYEGHPQCEICGRILCEGGTRCKDHVNY